MILDYAVGDREPEPGSLADFFGRKEWIENALFEALRNPRPAVVKTELSHRPVERAGDVDLSLRQIRNCVSGVMQEVNEDLLELDGIAKYHALLGEEIKLHLDLVQTKLLLQERKRALDHVIERNRLAADRRRATKGAQVRDNLGCLAHLPHRVLQRGHYALAIGRAQLNQIKRVSDKEPNVVELAHDFLWRIHRNVPRKGKIGIFNRSHYEEVLVTKVHPGYLLKQKLPGIDSVDKITEDFWKERYKRINGFEKNLNDSGTKIIKFFLHVSRKEQKKRFLARIEECP